MVSFSVFPSVQVESVPLGGTSDYVVIMYLSTWSGVCSLSLVVVYVEQGTLHLRASRSIGTCLRTATFGRVSNVLHPRPSRIKCRIYQGIFEGRHRDISAKFRPSPIALGAILARYCTGFLRGLAHYRRITSRSVERRREYEVQDFRSVARRPLDRRATDRFARCQAAVSTSQDEGAKFLSDRGTAMFEDIQEVMPARASGMFRPSQLVSTPTLHRLHHSNLSKRFRVLVTNFLARAFTRRRFRRFLGVNRHLQ